MQYIKTFYNRQAYEESDKTPPYIAFIIDTGEIIYNNRVYFSSDFNFDFDAVDFEEYLPFFKYYQ